MARVATDRMVRKQVYITRRQNELLKQRARDLGVTEAELVRRGVDEVTASPPTDRPDLKAWEEIKEYIEKHRKMDVPQTGRQWTRDELYEERMERYSR